MVNVSLQNRRWDYDKILFVVQSEFCFQHAYCYICTLKKKWFQLFVYVNFTSLVNLYSIIETHWWFRILLASVVYIIIKLFRFWEQRLLCWPENWYKATQSGVITLILKLTFCIVLFLYKYTNNHGIELLVFWNDA